MSAGRPFLLTLEALADRALEGRTDPPIEFVGVGPGRIAALWDRQR